MYRTALADLQNWLQSSDRKPLVMRGARQVGKTWLVRQLAKITGSQLIEINFEQNPQFASMFESNDPKQIIINLGAALNTTIAISKSILFLDEIQTVPELLSKLRWFAEDLPELAVISTGSLLDFVLAEHSFSMPVGRISYLHLEPLTFEEFLLAKGQKKLFEFIQNFSWQNSIPKLIHEKLLSLFKEYIIIGGMPAVTASWIKNNSPVEINRLHHELLTAYKDDFAKYAGKISTVRLEEVLTAFSQMLGKKFIYNKVNKEVSYTSIKNALQLLVKAGICHQVISTAANGIPLGAEINTKFFKVIGIDVGLVSAALKLGLHQMDSITEINLINSGGIAEQVVGQLLRTIEPGYIEPSLYYWVREQKNSAAEVDYLIQHQNKIIPIEVKAGSTGTLKSLHFFMALKKLQTAVRINSDVPTITQINTKIHNGSTIKYQLISIPFYLTQQLYRLLESC
ncbi:MAG: AAA family ATPase [Gammaproteobacteria bacterium]|jgi:predicted AAA+ superfamily ATPase